MTEYLVASDEHSAMRAFTAHFAVAPEVKVRVPGRVNLIGDHTDYHDGFVLPMNIERAITMHARQRLDRLVRVSSTALDTDLEIDLTSARRHPDRHAHYFQGVATILAARGHGLRGCDLLITSDLPIGGGLSSSSALVVGFAALLARLNRIEMSPRDLAIIGRDAEHWYGTAGGIMDQFVISHGQTGNAVLLDCRDLAYEQVPLPASVAVVIANSGVSHNQIASPFAGRRREAEAGLRVLQQRFPRVTMLRDVTLPMLAEGRAALLAADAAGTLWRRCRHVVSENTRVRTAATALTRGDLPTVGRLMAESHASLRDDYDVSCAELDALVATAANIPGCIGARMTGGGFGGCTVNLVAREQVDTFSTTLTAEYHRLTGRSAAVFATQAAASVCVTTLAAGSS